MISRTRTPTTQSWFAQVCLPLRFMGRIPSRCSHSFVLVSQIAHVNRGRHGFVIQAKDLVLGGKVAIKFLERDDVSHCDHGIVLLPSNCRRQPLDELVPPDPPDSPSIPLPADPLPPPSLQAMRNPKYLEREIFNQYKLRHPHIIRLLDVS